jgi:hypothetical protein
VRSLNFFQGLPLVSAAGGSSPLDFDGFFALSSPASDKGDAGHCRIFPFDFVCLLRRETDTDTIIPGDHHCDSSLHTRGGAHLLNFRSACIAGSDLA